MKQEVKVKAHLRHHKDGSVSMVRAHTAKRDKSTKGDGSELQARKAKNSLITPEEAEALGFAVPMSDRQWEEGEFKVPKKTGIGYKVFVLKDGKLYPPMVANKDAADTPIGEWLPANAPNIIGYTKATHRPQVKQGGKGTQGGSGTLSYRPGWHLGEIPYAIQFNRKDENGERTLFPNNFVWAEVEYAKDKDYQHEAESYGYNKNGKFNHSLAGLPKIPKHGAYKYRTNPDPNTDAWIITGAMKVNRVLTNEEVDDMVRKAGREPQKRQPKNKE